MVGVLIIFGIKMIENEYNNFWSSNNEVRTRKLIKVGDYKYTICIQEKEFENNMRNNFWSKGNEYYKSRSNIIWITRKDCRIFGVVIKK